MSNIVPRSRRELQLSPLQRAQAIRGQRRTELAVFEHGLAVAAQAECDIQDSMATESAARAALNAEIDLLDWGIYRAQGSPAKIELVARKVQMLSQLNDRRISRNFGA